MCNTIMALMLSLLVIYLTVGATFVKCQCTGMTHIMNPLDKANYESAKLQMMPNCEKSANKNVMKPDCMKSSVEKLSVSIQAPVYAYDFSADQPLLFIVPGIADLFSTTNIIHHSFEHIKDVLMPFPVYQQKQRKNK